MKSSTLRKAAGALNRICTLKPQIDTNSSNDVLEQNIDAAAELLTKDDVALITPELWEALQELAPDIWKELLAHYEVTRGNGKKGKSTATVEDPEEEEEEEPTTLPKRRKKVVEEDEDEDDVPTPKRRKKAVEEDEDEEEEPTTPPKRRKKVVEEDEDEDEKTPTVKSAPRGRGRRPAGEGSGNQFDNPGITTSIMMAIMKNPAISIDSIISALEARGLTPSVNTVNMQRSDTRKIIDYLIREHRLLDANGKIIKFDTLDEYIDSLGGEEPSTPKSRKSNKKEEDEPTPPKRRKKVIEEEEEEPIPPKRKRKIIEEEEEEEEEPTPPKRKKRAVEEDPEEEDEPTPPKRRRKVIEEDEEEDDVPTPPKRKKRMVSEIES